MMVDYVLVGGCETQWNFSIQNMFFPCLSICICSGDGIDPMRMLRGFVFLLATLNACHKRPVGAVSNYA
jgi:hypothetical protein